MRNGTAIGGPEADRADFAALRAYVRGLRLRLPLFDVLTPLPGTELFDAEQGRLTARATSSSTSPTQCFPPACRGTRYSAAVRSQLARRRLARLRALDREIGDLEGQLAELVAACGSSLPRLPGIGVLLAAKMLGETGDVRRFRSEAAFAAVTGTAPIPASSGQTQRHRLNRGGNRQLNRVLHFMAIVQTRTHPPAQAYVARRQAEGKTWREALRCLKRHLADVVYRTMLLDLQGATIRA